MGLGLGADAGPVVAHRPEPHLAPVRGLVGVVRAPGVARGAERDDPGAPLPVAEVEDVARDRAVRLSSKPAAGMKPAACTVSPSPPMGTDGGSGAAPPPGKTAASGWRGRVRWSAVPAPRRRIGAERLARAWRPPPRGRGPARPASSSPAGGASGRLADPLGQARLGAAPCGSRPPAASRANASLGEGAEERHQEVAHRARSRSAA